MEFIYYIVRSVICIFNIYTSFWFLENVLSTKGVADYKTKYIFKVLIFLLIIIGREKGFLISIIWYYIILIIYGLYIKGKINLLNIFWVIQSVSDCLSVFFVAYILGALLKRYTFIEFYNDNSLFRQIIFVYSAFFRVSVLKTQIRQKRVIENLSNKQLLISILVVSIIQFFLVITLGESILINNPITIYDGILVILLCGVNVFFYKILMFLSKEIEEKYYLEMSIKQSELEEKYLKEISQIYADIKSWKHDYRNNINVICNLAITNQHDKLYEYVEELDKEIIVAEALVYTGIFVVDSIITSKYLYGRNKGITFVVNTALVTQGAISDFDINIILSNILDNAIEGALKSKEKKIEINIFEKNNNIVFKIRNTFHGKIKKVNGIYITTKEGSIHGLGISRVMNAVEKYNGAIYMNHDNNVFENKVIIPLK